MKLVAILCGLVSAHPFLDHLNSLRMAKGIRAIPYSAELEGYYKKYLEKGQDSVEIARDVLGESACAFFEGVSGCDSMPVGEFLRNAKVQARELESEATFLKGGNVPWVYSQGNRHSCMAWASGAVVEHGSKKFVVLSVAGSVVESEYRVVDLPLERCNLKGAEAYVIPGPSKAKYEKLYNLLGRARTTNNLPPFKFSTTLSDPSSFQDGKLKEGVMFCQNSKDLACMNPSPSRSYGYSLLSLSMNSTNANGLEPYREFETLHPELNASPTEWLAVGFTEAGDQTILTFAHSNPPKPNKVKKVCRKIIAAQLGKN